MSTTQEDIIWTIKINKKMDKAVQKVLKQLGLDVRIVKLGRNPHKYKKPIQEKIHRKDR